MEVYLARLSKLAFLFATVTKRDKAKEEIIDVLCRGEIHAGVYFGLTFRFQAVCCRL